MQQPLVDVVVAAVAAVPVTASSPGRPFVARLVSGRLGSQPSSTAGEAVGTPTAGDHMGVVVLAEHTLVAAAAAVVAVAAVGGAVGGAAIGAAAVDAVVPGAAAVGVVVAGVVGRMGKEGAASSPNWDSNSKRGQEYCWA